jgi:hypothetical protein
MLLLLVCLIGRSFLQTSQCDGLTEQDCSSKSGGMCEYPGKCVESSEACAIMDDIINFAKNTGTQYDHWQYNTMCLTLTTCRYINAKCTKNVNSPCDNFGEQNCSSASGGMCEYKNKECVESPGGCAILDGIINEIKINSTIQIFSQYKTICENLTTCAYINAKCIDKVSVSVEYVETTYETTYEQPSEVDSSAVASLVVVIIIAVIMIAIIVVNIIVIVFFLRKKIPTTSPNKDSNSGV